MDVDISKKRVIKMILQSKYWPGILPALILLFFPLSYIVKIEQMNFPVSGTTFSLMYFGGIILIMLAISTKSSKDSMPFYNLTPFYLYLFFLIGILLIPSLFANDPVYSFTRVFFSVGSLGLTFTVFYIIQYIYTQKLKWQVFFEVTSLLLLTIIIIAQVLIEDWGAGRGGIRLSGGTNPNTIAFFALFILVQTHINALLANRWSKLQKVVWLISFIVIVWTFSRATLLIVFIIYFIYLFFYIFRQTSLSLKKGFKFKKRILSFMKLIGFTLVSWLVFIKVFNSNKFVFIKDRFLNTENIVSRDYAWDIILTSFYDNPLFGGLGWWGGSRVLATFSMDEIAHSPHNLFVRLLGEVGIVGMVIVLLLPAVILGCLILSKKSIKFYFESQIGVYLSAVILALFLGQFFEDKYLVGVFDLGNNIIIWLLSFSLIVYHFGIKKLNRRGKNEVE